MKKIFTFLSIAAISAGLNAQTTTEMTLSQTLDEVIPGSAGLLGCTDNDNGATYLRLFNLNDYGITSEFTLVKVNVGAIIWDTGYAESYIFNIDGPDYPETIPFDMFEDTGYYGFYSNNSGARVWDWVEFETFDEPTVPITPAKQFAVVVTGPQTNSDAGWLGTFMPLPTDAGYVKSSYFGAPMSGCGASDEDESVRLDTTTFSAYAATLLTVTGTVEGMGLVEIGGNALSVYPNPATDVVNIKMGDNKSVQSVEVVNMAGQTVYKAGAVNSLNINFLANGVYVLRVKDNAGVTRMSKIVKK